LARKVEMQLSRPNAMGGHWLITFSFHARKNTIVNNTITISDMHGSQARTNIDVGNEINHV
jgi:hypothetical protein